MSSELNFADLKYSELQRLAKDVGIKANVKSDKLIKALQDHFDKQSSTPEDILSTDIVQDEDEHQDVEPMPVDTGLQEQLSVKEEQQPKQTALTLKPTCIVSKQNKRGRKGRKKVKESTSSENVAEESNPEPVHVVRGKRKRSPSTPLQECSNVHEKGKPACEDADSQPSKRRRGMCELAPAAATPDTQHAPDVSEMVSAAQICQIESVSVEEDRESVGEVIQSMNPDLDSPEMKENLLAAIEKKVEKLLQAEGEKPVASICSSSQIPRFAAFLAKNKAAEKKPITPGNKNWTKIHQQHFNKMDSIDVYLAKKRQRTASVTLSIKKAKEAAERTREAMRKLNNHKTPDLTKRHKPLTTQSPRITKKVTPFKPSVVSTKTMNFNFSAQLKTPVFGAKSANSPKRSASGPSRKSPRTTQDSVDPTAVIQPTTINNKPSVTAKPAINISNPAVAATKPASVPTKPVVTITTPAVTATKPAAHRKSLGVLNSAPRPDTGDRRKSFVTPFKVGSPNITLENQSTVKKVFDLQASLAKPLSWKPHTGKLKPLDKNVSAATSHERLVKGPTVKIKSNRAERLAAAKDRRADQKLNSQMKRRGIVA